MARYVCKVKVTPRAARIECLDTVTGERVVRDVPWDWLTQGQIEGLKRHPDFEVTVEPVEEHT